MGNISDFWSGFIAYAEESLTSEGRQKIRYNID